MTKTKQKIRSKRVTLKGGIGTSKPPFFKTKRQQVIKRLVKNNVPERYYIHIDELLKTSEITSPEEVAILIIDKYVHENKYQVMKILRDNNVPTEYDRYIDELLKKPKLTTPEEVAHMIITNQESSLSKGSSLSKRSKPSV